MDVKISGPVSSVSCFIAVSPDPAVDQDPARTASIYLTEPKAIEVSLCVY